MQLACNKINDRFLNLLIAVDLVMTKSLCCDKPDVGQLQVAYFSSVGVRANDIVFVVDPQHGVGNIFYSPRCGVPGNRQAAQLLHGAVEYAPETFIEVKDPEEIIHGRNRFRGRGNQHKLNRWLLQSLHGK